MLSSLAKFENKCIARAVIKNTLYPAPVASTQDLSANQLDILTPKIYSEPSSNLSTYSYVTKGLGSILHVVGWAFLLYFYLLSTVYQSSILSIIFMFRHLDITEIHFRL